jgi:uncharacterized protein
MTRPVHYPAGVPCFVDTLTADVDAAMRFYGGIFGWEFGGPGTMPGDPPGRYFVARVEGDDVAGLGSAPAGEAPPPAWNTHVAVDSLHDAVARAQAAGASVILAPVDAPPAGRLAVVADPAGAAFCLWEADERRGATRVNEPSAWAMSALSTPDPEAAQAFYGELFGWRAEAFGDGMWVWRLPGYAGGVPGQPVPADVVAALMRGDEGEPATWSVDFWSTDADAAANAAPALGGSVVVAPFEAGGFRRTTLADPDGAAFTVSQLLVAH